MKPTTVILTLALIGSSAIAVEKSTSKLPIKIVGAKRFAKDDVPAVRTALGIPDDYKPWITKQKNGDLLVVCFHFLRKNGKYREWPVFWRSKDNGKTWSKRDERPQIAGREFSVNTLSDGTLIMTCHFLAQDAANKAGYTYSKIFRSTNQGKTWEEQRIGPKGFTIKNAKTMADWTTFEIPDPKRPGKMITMLGIGVSHGGKAAPDNVFLWRSHDSGKTWNKSLKCDTKGWADVDGFFCQSTTYRARSGKLLHPVRVDRSGPHWHIKGTPEKLKTERGDNGDRSMLWESTDNGRSWKRHKGDGRFGTYGEMYARFLRLSHKRLLLTFTVRSNPTDGYPLGVRAIVSYDDGETWKFKQDRLIISYINHKHSGGGFGNTVETNDGHLVTVHSYRGKDLKSHIEAVRWKLPYAK